MNTFARSVSSVFLGILQFALSFAQSIIIVPIILSYWSTGKYGLWLSCFAFFNLMRTLDAGHQAWVSNEFMRLYHINFEEAKEVLGSSIRIGLMVGFIELLIYVVAIAIGFDSNLVGFNTDKNINIGIIAMLFMWFLVGSAGGIIVKVILPMGLYNRTMIWGIINRVIEIILLLCTVLFSWEISNSLIIFSISLTIYSFIMLTDIKNQNHQLFPWWQTGSFRQGFKGFSTSLLLTINGFIDQFSTSGILIMIGNMGTPSMIPIFTTLRTVSNVFLQGNQITINPIVPDIVRYHAQDEKSKIISVFKINWWTMHFLLNLPILLLLPFIQPLYEWWTKGKLPYDQFLSYSLMGAIALISYGKVMMIYLSSINHFKTLFSTSLARIIILIPITYLSLRYFGLTYIGVGICISELFAALILPIYFSYRLIGKSYDLTELKWPFISLILFFSFLVIAFIQFISIWLYSIAVISVFSLILFAEWKGLPSHFKSMVRIFIKSKMRKI